LSQEFSSILDLDELLGKIAATVRTLINYDAFSIYLVDAEKRLLRSRFSVRFDQRVTVDNIPLGKGITGTAAENREAIRVTNTSLDPRYIESHADVRSELATPLIVQDRVVGVLDVESERLGFFTEDHQRTLSLLAPQIASSVENARLYEEIALREQRMDQDLKAARKLQHVLQPRVAPEIHGLEIAIRFAARARDFGRRVRLLRERRRVRGHRVWRCQRQRRGSSFVWRAGQRPAADSGNRASAVRRCS